MGRRVYPIVLAILLCAAGLVIVVTIDLLPLVPGYMDVALIAGATMVTGLPIYLIIHPPKFGDDGEDESGGGGEEPPPTQPEPPPPHDGMPAPDWGSFDDLREGWEREPANT